VSNSHRVGGGRRWPGWTVIGRLSSFGVSRKIAVSVTLGAALAAGAGISLAATSGGTASSSATINGCYNIKTKVVTVRTGGASQACPKGDRPLQWNITGPKGATGATGAQGPAGPPGPAGTVTPVTATANISVTNDPDTAAVAEPLEYPNGGIWALDNYAFTVTVIRHSAVDLSNCVSADTPADNTTCYYYTGSAAINGTFQALGGGTVSPLGGKPMNGTPDGTLNGTYDFEFYADSGALSAATVPATVNNAGERFAAGTSDPVWYATFFPKGTVLLGADGGGLTSIPQPDYSFTYLATSENCTAPQVQEKMVQAWNGNTGDITGNCASS
jgi:hypothetical protein